MRRQPNLCGQNPATGSRVWQAWLGTELPRMSIADGWDFLLRLERDGSLVPRRCVRAAIDWLGKSRPCRTQTLQGVTG